MYELDPLLRLSWFLATLATSTQPPVAEAAVPSMRATEAEIAARSALESALRPLQPLGPGAARAEGEAGIPNHPALTDRFFIGVGAGFLSSTTEARLNSSSGVGTNIDFEDAFGLDETDWTPQVVARWRFAERWRVELEYFELTRSNTVTTASDITWGNQTFPAGTQVRANFDVAVARVSCGYSFFKTQDKELGVALGFHVTDIRAGVEATGGGGDSGKVLAPLPVLSMYGQFALTDEWAVSSRLDAFRMEIDPYHGHIFSMGVDVLYQPFRNLGFGLGYRTLQIEGGVSGGDFNGEISTNYQGPIAYVSTSF